MLGFDIQIIWADAFNLKINWIHNLKLSTSCTNLHDQHFLGKSPQGWLTLAIHLQYLHMAKLFFCVIAKLETDADFLSVVGKANKSLPLPFSLSPSWYMYICVCVCVCVRACTCFYMYIMYVCLYICIMDEKLFFFSTDWFRIYIYISTSIHPSILNHSHHSVVI